MELAQLFSAFEGAWFDNVLFWGVAAAAGVVGLVAVVNALDMFYDSEAG